MKTVFHIPGPYSYKEVGGQGSSLLEVDGNIFCRERINSKRYPTGLVCGPWQKCVSIPGTGVHLLQGRCYWNEMYAVAVDGIGLLAVDSVNLQTCQINGETPAEARARTLEIENINKTVCNDISGGTPGVWRTNMLEVRKDLLENVGDRKKMPSVLRKTAMLAPDMYIRASMNTVGLAMVVLELRWGSHNYVNVTYTSPYRGFTWLEGEVFWNIPENCDGKGPLVLGIEDNGGEERCSTTVFVNFGAGNNTPKWSEYICGMGAVCVGNNGYTWMYNGGTRLPGLHLYDLPKPPKGYMSAPVFAPRADDGEAVYDRASLVELRQPGTDETVQCIRLDTEDGQSNFRVIGE